MLFDLLCIFVVFLKTNFSTTLICFTFGFEEKSITFLMFVLDVTSGPGGGGGTAPPPSPPLVMCFDH